jgi:hypothetical protein
MFLSQMRARNVNTRLQLTMAQKGNLSVAGYINKMRSVADEMFTTGRIIEEEELVEYILVGLGSEYDPIVSTVIARTDAVPISELYSQLLAFETRRVLMNAHEGGSSVNSVSHGHGRSGHDGFGRTSGRDDSPSSFSRGGFGRGGNSRGNYSRGGYNNSSSIDKRPTCKCARRGGTWLTGAGTVLKKTMLLKRELQQQLWVIIAGTRILVQPIT